MLKSLLAEKLRQDGVSVRDAARQIGVSHTTINRFLSGDIPNVENLAAISKWLGISLSTVLNVESGADDTIATRIAMIIGADPRLKKLFSDIVADHEEGNLTSSDVEDILAYAAFRLGKKKVEDGSQEIDDALSKGNRGDHQ